MDLRLREARQTRIVAADFGAGQPHPDHLSNGDESRYRIGNDLSYIGNFTKGLPHPGGLGHVDPAAYRAMMRALSSGSSIDFETIPLGAPVGGRRKLIDPQAGLAFDLEGPDPQEPVIPPAPRLDSAEAAAEMAELYWMALLRDVPFTAYSANPLAASAVASLNTYSDFRGPKLLGNVTDLTLFRGATAGDLVGPYISQFLWLPITYGTLMVTQKQMTAIPNLDYLIDFADWRIVQDGVPAGPDQFDTRRRYIRNLRDLATYVHFDALYEAYLNACLILLGLRAPLDPGNPYRDSATQDGFGTFGGPHILSLVCEVATRALKAVWFQKWYVHRRLRPEAYGGLVHNQVKGSFDYQGALHPEALNVGAGSALAAVHASNVAKGHDTFLLPMAFPEGSPLHPSYGAGHATVAGACVTVLKAWFDESWVLPNPVIPTPNGLQLSAYVGADLTVGGELDKVAANIAIGRNAGGVHWRSDYTESVKLGEAVAIRILQELKLCLNEDFSLSLTKFDGTAITI